jgi:hypothetical protein
MREYFLFPFPNNSFGLERGTVLVANEEIMKYGINQGELLAIGFDGRCVCSGNIRWTINEIEAEIDLGLWDISEQTMNFDDAELFLDFLLIVENRSFCTH